MQTVIATLLLVIEQMYVISVLKHEPNVVKKNSNKEVLPRWIPVWSMPG